ncbi:type VI secretion system ImpA family N-terminal domain-containing protein [Photobacterium makurazakiensis]|uniref:type VI secretion system protein TssA n=1 Tax=Photobacterium makurazakiensis TaxID=2910234 RepID=UPI003D0DB491
MFDELLQPISEEQPGGEYLKDNRVLYRSYRNAFNVAQSSFRQLIETPEALENAETVNANNENWTQLASECRSCLSEHSKDVEILSWYTVSQLFTSDPINNLANALSAFDQVVNQYWDTLQPILPEKKRKGATEADQTKEVTEHRVKPLLQLVGDTAESGLLYMPLQMIPLVGDIDFGRFFAAEKTGNLSALKQTASECFSTEQADIESKIVALGKVLDSMTVLEQSLAKKCAAAGVSSVSFRFVKESIERLINAVQFLVGEQFSQWPLDVGSVQPEVQGMIAGTVDQPPVALAISDSRQEGGRTSERQQAAQPAAIGTHTLASRDQALAELQKIADYFQQTEPHSPIYLLLKRAIRWGGMSLPELLQELVGDQDSVNQRIQQLAGLESAEHQATLVPASAPLNEVQASSAVSMPLDEPTQNSRTTSNSPDSDGLSEIEW